MVRQQKVNISPGRPITVATPEDMSSRGAVEGAAAREVGLYESIDPATEISVADVSAIVDTHEWRASQAAAMTVSRHEVGIAEANAEVMTTSNELSAATSTLEEAQDQLAAARDANRHFAQRVMELADRTLAPTLPSPAPQHLGAKDAKQEGVPAIVGLTRTTEGHVTGLERQGSAWRFPLHRDLPQAAVALVLSLIVGAEFALNARAFQSVREVEWLVLLLAGLVGVGMVALAHRIGSNARDLLEVPLGAKGRSPAKLVEVALEIPALLAGIVGVATIRASYFKLVGITIPTFGLVCIQVALAVAAIGTTMAGRNQAADENRDRERQVEERAHERRQPLKAYLAAQNRLVVAEAGLWNALQGLVTDFNIQIADVALGMNEYIISYSLAARIKVTGTVPEVEKPALVVQAEAWLAAHPVGTYAHRQLPYTSAPGGQPANVEDDGATGAGSDVTPIIEDDTSQEKAA